MGLKYEIHGCNYPVDTNPKDAVSTRWFIATVFWFAVFSIKYDAVNVYKRRC